MTHISLRKGVPVWLHYAFAVLLVALAAAMRVWPLQSLDASLEWLTFYPAVAVAAIYGGIIAGFVATICSVFVVTFCWTFFSGHPSVVGSAQDLEMTIFIVNGLLVSGVTEAMHRAQSRAIKAEEQARMSYQSDVLFDNSPIGMLANDPKSGRIIRANQVALKMWGYSIEEILAKTINDLIHPFDLALTRQMNRQLAQGLTEKVDYEKRYLRKDGSFFWARTSVSPLKDAQGNIDLFNASTIDITERKQNEQALLQQNQFSEDIINSLPGIFYMLDSRGKFHRVNQHFLSVTGYSKDELERMTALDLFEGQDKKHILQKIHEAFESGNSDAEAELITKSNQKSPYYFTASRTNIDGHIYIVGLGTDVTEQKRTAKRIEKLAHFDQLTGLSNRALLQDEFKCASCMAQRNGDPLAVMFVDLDHFKDINDALGHSVGDLVLIEVATRLKAALSEGDSLSRQGGDEFVVILPGTDAEDAAAIATKLIEMISQPCHIEQYELCITPSIGIAMYPHDGATLEILSKNADSAMYRAKHAGRNDFRFYTPEMQLQSERHLKLASALRYALARKELHLNYQPQVSMQYGHVVGVEALLRWNHPEMGMISPAEFIPIAEDSGLIIPIGEWVLRTATRQLKVWMDGGLPPMIMAVNLSPVQFRQNDFPELVTRILSEVNLPHQYLELELTEAATMHDPLAAIAAMNKLHDLGIRMSIDDFGTGYCSLSYLKRFKVYKIKIDQSFVRDITDDPDDRAIVAAIISLANSLGLKTIAEGVETPGQLASLRLQGCDEAQGYFFSRPLASDQIEPFVRAIRSISNRSQSANARNEFEATCGKLASAISILPITSCGLETGVCLYRCQSGSVCQGRPSAVKRAGTLPLHLLVEATAATAAAQ